MELSISVWEMWHNDYSSSLLRKQLIKLFIYLFIYGIVI